MKASNLLCFSLLLGLSAFSSSSPAGIQVGGTRVVFPASSREASIQVRNEGSEDIMIQSWVEPAPEAKGSPVPFAITPSLARLGGKQQQMLRIFYQGKGLPEDQESVFWLSVQEIPQVAEDSNSLQIAFRQRLKLFYRPHHLPGTAEEAAKNLNWNFLNEAGQPLLLAANPSVFHVSLAKIKVVADNKEYFADARMLNPRGTAKFKLKGLPSSFRGTAQVHWQSINDYGGLVDHQAPVNF
ncbi:P pilus assembly chaperone PapD [Pseudomonas nitritireducens]|uniref:P pilus assembly chaperone PapD n=1 Tax=Pseudomonas nitroreducens TaxID=46680 RepID=A0A7W7KJR0_PSENT|nr:molecular chaperone [Pseudomonas nitritireducens]MBB4864071.1 P pilus assembly chaperone PapD [Pseudomonas nitritireducens]